MISTGKDSFNDRFNKFSMCSPPFTFIIYEHRFDFNIELEHSFVYNVNEVKLMNVLIEINYIGWESRISQKGNFAVDSWKFKEDPDWTVAAAALTWINKIRRENNVSKIINVTYNNEHDITNIVMDLGNRIYNNLPF